MERLQDLETLYFLRVNSYFVDIGIKGNHCSIAKLKDSSMFDLIIYRFLIFNI
jgi:hypothetical protein